MSQYIGKPQVLKEVNSSMIEQLVYEHGPLSKPELSKRTSLSLPTISKLVDDLEKNGRLCRAGFTGKGAGRKAALYETNRNSGCLLACYYERGTFRRRLADMMNNALYEDTFPMNGGSFEDAVNSTFRAIDTLMDRAPAPVKIIGIGVPGVIQPGGRLLGIPQIAVWEGLNLKNLLSLRYKTAVYVENGVNLRAVGYYHTHLQEKQDNLVYLYVGNGIGSGIILNRQLYRGGAHFSGEIGFMTTIHKAGGRDYTINGGFMENYMDRLVDYAGGDLRQKDDPEAREELASILCMIAVNHVAVLNPEIIVFGGRIFDKHLVRSIGRKMACYLPAATMPRITQDQNRETGLDGLILSCRGNITTGMRLVQSSGIQRRTRLPA